MFISKTNTCIQIPFLVVPENKQIPSEIAEDAVALEKTLNWDDEGADGMYLEISINRKGCKKQSNIKITKYLRIF